ncbi:MAG: hypothetical protein ACI4V3_08720 [Faecousia sp.]
MGFAEYKLRTHQQYIRLLEVLNPLTAFIELVPVSPEDDLVVHWALQNMELIEQDAESERYKTGDGKPIYTRYLFRWSEAAFRYLGSLHNFYIYVESPAGHNADVLMETEFAWTDVAFLDEKRNTIFYTITHEGYAFIQESLREIV